MRKIVINRIHGGFGLASAVLEEYNTLTQKNVEWEHEISRDDPVLIEILERVGLEHSGGKYSKLKIVEIPDDVEWKIEEYDGLEWVAERHRTWN